MNHLFSDKGSSCKSILYIQRKYIIHTNCLYKFEVYFNELSLRNDIKTYLVSGCFFSVIAIHKCYNYAKNYQ